MMKWKKKLDDRGIPSDGPIQLGPPGQASLYFNDPSGNHLEIVTLGFGIAVPVRPPETARLAWNRKPRGRTEPVAAAAE
jgi:hypothetical protein